MQTKRKILWGMYFFVFVHMMLLRGPNTNFIA